jgi:hypothetical protein
VPKNYYYALSTFVLILSLFQILFLPCVTLAQEDNSVGIKTGETLTQPKERPVKVTASVNDQTPPSVPILIAPPNDSLLADNTPTFVWKESTDAFTIKKYILTLDGNELYASIPTTATETNDFNLTYDSITGYYSLTPRSSIADGTHTWKITAVDAHNNTASSVTWSFTIDSQSPVFVVTQVDTQPQSISAQDISTVPTVPIELTVNEPILQGTGEAKSTVDLTVRTSTSTLASYTFTIADNGTWQVQLGVLPRDIVIYLDFRITDRVNHVSILENVPLILKTPKITIPPIPFLPPPEEPITIPIPPPKEVIQKVITEVAPPAVAKLMGVFPNLAATPKPVGQFSIWSILVLFIISALPILKTVLLAARFGTNFSLNNLLEIWRVIGILPPPRPQGIVVFQHSQAPVPFAKVTITGKLDTYRQVTITRLTNAEGVYFHSELDTGLYQVVATQHEALFPTLIKKPEHLLETHYYQGQEFQITKDLAEPILVIPVDHIVKQWPLHTLISEWLLHQQMRNLPTVVVAILITVVATSPINSLVTTVYVLSLLFSKVQFWKQQRIGQTVTLDTQPLQNVILFHFSEDILLREITQSSPTGTFTLHTTGKRLALGCIDLTYKIIEPPTTPSLPANIVSIAVPASKREVITLVGALN